MARKGGNPDLKQYEFQPEGEEPRTKNLCVRVTESMYQEVKSQDNPSEFMRDAIQEALDKNKQA